MNIKKLNDLLYYLDSKYDINSGGCCFVAYCIAKNLDRLRITDYKLVLYTYGRTVNISRIRNNIKLKKNHVFPIGKRNCSHYAIQFNNIIINPSNRQYKVVIPNINHDDIIHIYNMGYWNESYNASNNSIIEKTIDNFFNKYETKKQE